jgi:hypothetical protein
MIRFISLMLAIGLSGSVDARSRGVDAVINAEPTDGVAPLTVVFDGSESTGSITRYRWEVHKDRCRRYSRSRDRAYGETVVRPSMRRERTVWSLTCATDAEGATVRG